MGKRGRNRDRLCEREYSEDALKSGGVGLVVAFFFSRTERPGKDAAKRLTDMVAAKRWTVVETVEDDLLMVI